MSNHDHHTDPLALGDLGEDPLEVSAALAAAGWKRQKGDPETYLHRAGGGATLAVLDQGARWTRYRLSGDSLRAPRANSVLTQNATLAFPAKYVSGPKRQVDCVIDLPLEALTQPDTQPDHQTHSTSGLAAWSQGLTGALIGKCVRLQHASSEQIVQSLGQLGWSATAEGESLEVHLQLPNVYRRLQIEPAQVGYRVSAHLISLTELSSASARAVRQLSLEANRRLPLVRFSEDVISDPPQLVSEVQINVALVPDVWLVQAIAAVEAAVTTTTRELLALRDLELAQIFLAAR